MITLVTLCALVILPFADTMTKNEIDQKHYKLFYACTMLCLAGLCGVIVTGDVFNLFVFLEISALASYILIAMGARQNKKAIKAAWDYLLLGTIGATFFVIGIGLLFMVTGTLNIVDMANLLATLETNRTVQSAFVFIIVGMTLKAAIYPLHRWLPGAYTCAPSAISTLLAATSTKVAIYIILRFLFSVYTAEYQYEANIMKFIFLPVGIVAMFLGSLLAIYRATLKRMFAYSSIAQIGMMVIGVSLASPTGLTATISMMGNHAITKAALFIATGAFLLQISTKNNLSTLAQMPIAYLAGIGRQMPWTSAGFVIAGLSLIGVPATAGFIAKWILLLALFEQGKWPVAVLMVIASLLTIIYVWKVIETLYLKQPINKVKVTEAPLTVLVPLWIFVAIIVYAGVQPYGFIEVIENSAVQLINGGFIQEPLQLGRTR